MKLSVNQKFLFIVFGVVAVSVLFSWAFVSQNPVVYNCVNPQALRSDDTTYMVPTVLLVPAPCGSTVVLYPTGEIFFIQPVPENGLLMPANVVIAQNLTTRSVIG
ncbi:MAG: hypothetical protein NWE92_00160 [Candidatus Bathyarchaeota archaeon]|nr:hypothetical protein [Candidatus Bathyarchaeota archaeon]